MRTTRCDSASVTDAHAIARERPAAVNLDLEGLDINQHGDGGTVAARGGRVLPGGRRGTRSALHDGDQGQSGVAHDVGSEWLEMGVRNVQRVSDFRLGNGRTRASR